jgi:hypothetical protein
MRYFLITPFCTVDREDMSYVSLANNGDTWVDSNPDVSSIEVGLKRGRIFMMQLHTSVVQESFDRLSEWLGRGLLSDFEMGKEEGIE